MAKPNTFTQEEKRAYLESKQKQREELEFGTWSIPSATPTLSNRTCPR